MGVFAKKIFQTLTKPPRRGLKNRVFVVGFWMLKVGVIKPGVQTRSPPAGEIFNLFEVLVGYLSSFATTFGGNPNSSMLDSMVQSIDSEKLK